jgi:alkaline phosphatase D
VPESVILWTHPTPADLTDKRPVCLEYQVSASNDSFADLIASGQVWTTADVDYSYKVEPKGLTAKQTYYYRWVEACGLLLCAHVRFANCADKNNVSPVGRFKTIPYEDDADVDSVSFA